MCVILFCSGFFFQDFLKYSSKAGLDCQEIEVRRLKKLIYICIYQHSGVNEREEDSNCYHFNIS